jgi:hypothetical protein
VQSAPSFDKLGSLVRAQYRPSAQPGGLSVKEEAPKGPLVVCGRIVVGFAD